ncbi:MAG: type 4a pilus biogenesis protein PilO [Candidatus Omnitrophota bacterium]
MKIDREKALIAGGGALLFLIIAVYLLFYQPLISELKTAYSEFKVYDADIRHAYNVISSTKMIDTKKVFITERALITESDISAAIAELTKRSDLHDINFVSMKPGDMEKQKDPRFKIMPISMKTESTYAELGLFLGLLDDLEDGVVTLRSFKVVPNKHNPVKLESNIVINLYLSSRDER